MSSSQTGTDMTGAAAGDDVAGDDATAGDESVGDEVAGDEAVAAKSTYEQIAYDQFVRRRQHSEETQLRGIEQGHADGGFTGLDGKARHLISTAQHFYLSTVTGAGWPYVQHRGGPAGFVRVSDDGRRLAWAEFHGNNQFVSTGNIDRDGRVCLFFIDYPLRRRLKVFGHARVVETDEDPALLAWVTGREEGSEGPTLQQPVARIFVVVIVDSDANCSKHILPRWDKSQVDERLELYRADIRKLEAELAELREQKD